MPPYNYCAVDGCKSQKNNRSLSFFSLPVDETRRKRWLEVIGRPDLNNPKTNPKCHFVCSLHFEKYMITSKPILRLDAEPVRFLPNQPTSSFGNYRDYKEVSTQTTECYLNGVSALNNDSLYTFPEVPIIKQENVQDEATIKSENIEITIARIKQEYIENDTALEDINGEDFQTSNTRIPVPCRKTKEPRKTRNRKLRKEFKDHKNKPANSTSIK